MPWDVTCPKCQRKFPVSEARQAIGIKCPKCDAELAVEFRVPPGQSTPQVRVSLGYPPSANAYASLANQHESDSAKQRRLQPHRNSMVGVMVIGLGTLLLSVGGLGAAGYFLFTNLEPSDSVASRASNKSVPSTPTTTDPATPTPVTPNLPPDPPPRKKLEKDKFELRPVTGVIPAIKPPQLAGDTAIDMNTVGGKPGAITVAGGGRYIVMHFPDKGVLNVFDVSEGRFLGEVAADKGAVKLAGGVSWVVASVPSGNGKAVLRAYTLPNLEKRYDGLIDFPHTVNAIAMGNRTEGPLLLVNSASEVALFDITATSFQEVEWSRKKPGIQSQHVSASPDGTAFLCYSVSSQPMFKRDIKVLTEVDQSWNALKIDQPVIFPGPDGLFYGSLSGSVDRKNTVQMFPVGIPISVGKTWLLPPITRQGDQPLVKQGFILRIETVLPQPPAQQKPTFSLMVTAGANVLVPHGGTPILQALPEFEGMFEPNGLPKPNLDQHFFLVPEAKLLILLSGDRNKLLLKKLNI